MSKIKNILILIVIIAFSNNIYTQTCQWAKTAKGENNWDWPMSIKTDAYGNIYVVGAFRSDSIKFGNIPALINNGDYDVFIAKYNSSGNILWAKSAGGSSIDGANGVTTDANGNVYITGESTSSSIQFGNLPALTNPGIFIVKYDSSGNALWVKSAGGGMGSCITADAYGNVYISGSFSSTTIQFGSTPVLTNNGVNDIYIVKYSPSGNAIWSKNAGGIGNYGGTQSINIDANDNIYISGTFSSQTFQFGNTSILINNSTSNNTDIFITKFDSSGNVLWAKSAGGISMDAANGITTDATGNIYVTGSFNSPSIQLGNTPTLINTSNNGFYDMFIAKFNSSGNALWAKSYGGLWDEVGDRIVTDIYGNIYIGGYFDDLYIQFGNTPVLTSNGGADIFITKFDSSGNALWSKSAGGNSNENFRSISSDSNGNIYISGDCTSSFVQFGTNPSTILYDESYSQDKIFIAKYTTNDTLTASSSIICNGASTTLSVLIGLPIKEDTWHWYTGSCGGTPAGTGINLSVSPTVTTIYYVRAEGSGNTSTCVSILVIVSDTSNIASSATATPNSICIGDSSSLSIIGGILSNGAIWNWYSGSCGGSHEGIGAILNVSPVVTTNYYVRAEGICNTTGCVSVTTMVSITGSLSTMPNAAIATPYIICKGDTSILGLTGGTSGTGAWNWYSGSCGGIFEGTGINLSIFPSLTTIYYVRAEGDCNITLCVSVTVIVNDYPLIPAAISGNISPVTGNTETYSTTNVTGITYSWSAPSGWVGSSTSGSITYIAGVTNGIISVVPNNTCGAGIGRSLIVGTGGFRINGYFTYDNFSNTPLDSVWVFLKLNGSKLDSVQADYNGYYEFNNIPDGNYNISASTHKLWSGVNSTDAVKVKRHFAGSELLSSSIRLHAGDVNLSMGINTTDAVKITRRFVGTDTSFTRGDWVFEKPLGGDTLNVSVYMNDTVVVNGGNVSQNFKGLCVGDVNGSNYPSQGAKSLFASKVKFNYSNVKILNSNESFELPIIATTNINIGAISLILKFSKELITINSVQLSKINENSKLIYNVHEDELRIGWFECEDAINLKNNETLIIIRGKTTGNFKAGDVIKFSIKNNPLCEIADKNGNSIDNLVLNTYTIEYADGQNIENDNLTLNNDLNIYPNPFSQSTTIEFNLPESGIVSIDIFNIFGERLLNATDRYFIQGRHEVGVNMSDFADGIYTCKVKYFLKGKVLSKTFRMSVVR